MNPNRLSLLVERTIEQNKYLFPYRCSILDTSNPQQICKYEEALFEAFIRTNNQIILKIWDWDFTNRRVRTRISYNNQIVYAMIDEDEHIVFSVSVNTSTLNTQFAQLGFVVPDSNKSYCEALNLFANQNYDISGFQIINFCNYFKAYWFVAISASLFIGFLLSALVTVPLIINLTVDPFTFPGNVILCAIAAVIFGVILTFSQWLILRQSEMTPRVFAVINTFVGILVYFLLVWLNEGTLEWSGNPINGWKTALIFLLGGAITGAASEVGGIVIHFGQGHDHKYGQETIEAIPSKGVGIMDRGFASSERISELKEQKNQAFVLRIKNNVTLEMLENGNCKVGKNEREVEIRVVAFCDIETRSEFRLTTNLLNEEEEQVSNQEIMEIYIQRWQIELLWKFLKMHLKLDKLMTKSENGIRIQIMCCLIAYLILQLIEIPQKFGKTLLDKLRYLQSYMCQEISYVHWFRKLIWIR